MKVKADKFTQGIGSNLVFVFTVVFFIAEAGYLALTSRFPMAFDEAYHFGLIQFFSQRLNPIVSYQTANTYKFGAIVHDPSFLYHYLMSFPYRLISLCTNNPEIQVVSLRFINILLVVISLIVMRRILRLINVSPAFANVVLLAFALTPLVTVLAAQINYDNLLLLASSLCVYETLRFSKKLGSGNFDVKNLLALISLCLFSSLVKFAFLPIFVGIAAVLAWKIAGYWHRDAAGMMQSVRQGFTAVSRRTKFALLAICVAGALLFGKFYIVNLAVYHSPVPQCNQVLSEADCLHYYAWNKNHAVRAYYQAHPSAHPLNILDYGAYWLLVNTLELFGVLVPLQGTFHASQIYTVGVLLIGSLAVLCAAVNFKKIMRSNRNLPILAIVTLVYLLFLWVRNYHDYVQLGTPEAVDGRYLVPVLVYCYILLGAGLQYALRIPRVLGVPAPTVKLALALTVIFLFVCGGGFNQYVFYIDPVYGHLSPHNNFILESA